jgi:hypothetical protein
VLVVLHGGFTTHPKRGEANTLCATVNAELALFAIKRTAWRWRQQITVYTKSKNTS